MKYDSENDRLVSEEHDVKIYPSGYSFPKSYSVEVEINAEFLNVPKNSIRELADGLLNAAERLGV